jgi:hypothetical protein
MTTHSTRGEAPQRSGDDPGDRGSATSNERHNCDEDASLFLRRLVDSFCMVTEPQDNVTRFERLLYLAKCHWRNHEFQA